MADPNATGWYIAESGFDPERQLRAESVFSLSNGFMGHRGSFEEQYSGKSRPANYLSGLTVQEPIAADEILPGYPAHRTVLANAPAWIGLDLEFDGEVLDLSRCEILHFERTLHLREAFLERTFIARMPSGRKVSVAARRFCSAVDKELGALQYIIQPLDFSGTLALTTGVDAGIGGEGQSTPHWAEVESRQSRTQAFLLAENKQSGVQVCTGMKLVIRHNGNTADYHSFRIQRDRYSGLSVDMPCKKGDRIEILKYAAFASAHQDKDAAALFGRCRRLLRTSAQKGFQALFAEHARVWSGLWGSADIQIEGEAEAQQAVRFNIFHLLQSYNGSDERLHIGTHGLTGEQSGGAAQWTSDLFLPPFFAASGNLQAARSLLLSRYRQLTRAKHAAVAMGFGDGAALFPMATFYGEESVAQWEFTFEAIHRNAAVAYAIYRYVLQTGDIDYLYSYGLETVVAIARFWTQRVQFCNINKRYELHGVTGPNDYEINVSNNWYTNYIAAWCLRFAAEIAADARKTMPLGGDAVLSWPEEAECSQWLTISSNLYLPVDQKSGLFLQQEGFQLKQALSRSDLDPEGLPIRKHWTLDRILRSPLLRNADLLQAFFLFEKGFSPEQMAQHFDYYEPKTVYESGFSYAIHALIAARLDRRAQAHELTMKALRLDLDDLQEETSRGCNLPAMGAAWWAIVFGAGGITLEENGISLRPVLPFCWKSLRFALSYRNCRLQIHLTKTQCHLVNLSGRELEVRVFQKPYVLPGWGEIIALNAERLQTNDQ